MATAATPIPVETSPGNELSAEYAVLLSVVASILVFCINQFSKARGKKISRGWLTILVYGLSVLLAYLWSAPSWPVLPSGSDPAIVSQAYLNFVSALLQQGAVILGFATLIYNWLLKRVDESLAQRTETIGPDAQSGQGMVEYALILVLVAVVVIVALTVMGPLVRDVFSTINASLELPQS
jgi:pilus assembly protein Flp/PilA